jgi:hypothetical protein
LFSARWRAFISVLTLRMNRVVDRSQMLNAIDDADTARARLKADLPRTEPAPHSPEQRYPVRGFERDFRDAAGGGFLRQRLVHIEHERGIAVLFNPRIFRRSAD